MINKIRTLLELAKYHRLKKKTSLESGVSFIWFRVSGNSVRIKYEKTWVMAHPLLRGCLSKTALVDLFLFLSWRIKKKSSVRTLILHFFNTIVEVKWNIRAYYRQSDSNYSLWIRKRRCTVVGLGVRFEKAIC